MGEFWELLSWIQLRLGKPYQKKAYYCCRPISKAGSRSSLWESVGILVGVVGLPWNGQLALDVRIPIMHVIAGSKLIVLIEVSSCLSIASSDQKVTLFGTFNMFSKASSLVLKMFSDNVSKVHKWPVFTQKLSNLVWRWTPTKVCSGQILSQRSSRSCRGNSSPPLSPICEHAIMTNKTITMTKNVLIFRVVKFLQVVEGHLLWSHGEL